VYNAEIQNSGCGLNSIPVLMMDDSVTLAKEMYAMLLAAKTSGKKVNIITEGCWVNGDYPKIKSIYWNN
ncbi:MAG: hypothetical protein OQJ89_11665, partial [Kangiellaceae bacterium]|nr:hypothetical protein [Kangiellaceae bacterium]